VGGLVANALNIVATVLVARLLTTRQYGGVAQLLGLFFVLSMPGSALLVGVLRRITAMAAKGHDELAHRWTTKLYRRSLLVLVAWSAFAFAIEAPLARALRLPDNGSVAFILIAGGVWALLCIDRAILQAHRRYAGLGLNLMIEIGVRTVLVLGFAIAGLGIWGYALGLLLGEIVAAAEARVAGSGAWGYPARAALPSDDSMGTRALSIDLVTALIGFALLGCSRMPTSSWWAASSRRIPARTRPSRWRRRPSYSAPSSSAVTCCPRPRSAGTAASMRCGSWP